jgi:hypothetical protein
MNQAIYWLGVRIEAIPNGSSPTGQRGSWGMSDMDTSLPAKNSPCEWEIPAQEKMKVPVVIYGTEAVVHDMDE